MASWREFDPIASSTTRPESLLSFASTVRDYTFRSQKDAWIERLERRTNRDPADAYSQMFLGRGWIPVMGAELQEKAAALGDLSCDDQLATLLELSEVGIRRDKAPLIESQDFEKTLGFVNFRRADLVELMERVRHGKTGDAPALFYDALSAQCAPDSRIACKAADQVMHLSRLREASPKARHVAIIRDGRDAAISAKHFEALMRKEEAPWRVSQTGSTRRLAGWAVRAAKLEYHAKRGDLAVVRYEDLVHDFQRTCAALFDYLELDHDEELLKAVQNSTDFSAASQGRSRGESAEHIVRKGATGEWIDTYSATESTVAWRLAGTELERFGYSQNGEIKDSPLIL